MNNDDVKLNLVLSVNEVNVILSALRELPHRVVDSLITNLVAQAQGQLQPKQEEVN